jgi:NTP pyrophosphatase (non-canonical NTP hydrolase)
MTLKELQNLILAQAKDKDWGTNPDEVIFGEKLALLHQEASEALEAYRKGNIDGEHGLSEELGDVIMRTLHLAAIYDLDLESEILKKIETNKSRDWSKDQLYIDRDNRAKK